jgi:hypothetical protein|tara:strand:- start:1998 stop:2204 length:207 start_codon:yes stop_codon:yes gene_type:complete
MTSNSNLTPRVISILETGLPVFSFRKRKTTMPFVNPCYHFINTENLREKSEEKDDSESGDAAEPTASA